MIALWVGSSLAVLPARVVVGPVVGWLAVEGGLGRADGPDPGADEVVGVVESPPSATVRPLPITVVRAAASCGLTKRPPQAARPRAERVRPAAKSARAGARTSGTFEERDRAAESGNRRPERSQGRAVLVAAGAPPRGEVADERVDVGIDQLQGLTLADGLLQVGRALRGEL